MPRYALGLISCEVIYEKYIWEFEQVVQMWNLSFNVKLDGRST